MTIKTITDVEFGAQLPVFAPDTTLENVRRFARAAGWDRPRFTDHEAARKEGLPGGIHTAAPAPQDGWELVPPKQAVRRFLNVV